MDPISPVPETPFRLRLRGVRGSVPVACKSQLGIGGNTPCLELKLDPDEPVIFDAGTGIRALGREIAARATQPRVIHLFFTHFHWDHLQGSSLLPAVVYGDEQSNFSTLPTPPEELRHVLAGQMRGPYFPVLFEHLGCGMEFRQINGEPQGFGGVCVESFPLHHPQGCSGYAITQAGKRVIYATDHEHGDQATHDGLLERARDADALIYDAQYTPAEYAQNRHGWGHSTWQEGVKLAQAAGVQKLVLFHHDPERDDEAVRRIEEEARAEFAGTVAAYEGLEL